MSRGMCQTHYLRYRAGKRGVDLTRPIARIEADIPAEVIEAIAALGPHKLQSNGAGYGAVATDVEAVIITNTGS